MAPRVAADRPTAPPVRETFPAAFRRRCQVSADRVALREKRLGIWREHTWAEYYGHARAFGLGLVALGLEKGDRVAIHSEDRPEWLFSEIGAICVGATSLGIYPTSPPSEVEYLLAHSGARFLVAEDQEQVDKALAVADRCPALERVICIDPRGLRGYHDRRLLPYEEVERLGRELAEADPERFERLIDERGVEEIPMLVYTSGTTGPPKGAMLSGASLAYALQVAAQTWNASEDDRILSYLPLCHVAEKLFSIHIPIATGASANFAESVDTVPRNLREVKPTIFLGVPRIWEKLAAGVAIRERDADPLKRATFRVGLALGRRLAKVWIRERGRYPFPWNLVYLVGWLLFFGPLQEKLGLSRCHTPVSGAAPIAPEVLRFFHAIGIHIREAWGMTENAATGIITPADDVCIGTVGRATMGAQVRIADDGEILFRSPCVFDGYYKDPEASARAIDAEGWLHTGDVGVLDEHGHVRITDRKKDLIITSGGKNIAPSEIENKLKASPYIREACVIGDRRAFLVALVGVERDTVADWAQRQRITFTTYRDLTEKPQVVELVADEVRRVNRELSSPEQVSKFRLLPKELDHEGGDLTATQKVKRQSIEESFRELIDEMYGSRR
jgi:long-chain acyl-CoA synthetase